GDLQRETKRLLHVLGKRLAHRSHGTLSLETEPHRRPDDRRKYTFGPEDLDDGFARFWVSNGANKQELADADRLVPWCILDLQGTPVRVPLEAPPARDDETLPLLNARSTSKPKQPALLFALYAVSSGAKHRELVLVDA